MKRTSSNRNKIFKTGSALTGIFALFLILSGCTTGRYSAKSHDDDIYFSTRDAVAQEDYEDQQVQSVQHPAKSAENVIISHTQTNPDGTQIQKNYIFKNENQPVNIDTEGMNLVSSDTTQYVANDSTKYVINNYYEGDDVDFEYRLHRFHGPFRYSPFYWDWYGWNDWYSPYPYVGFGWGFGLYYGYSPFYNGWYDWGFYYPYNYGWGWPYYAASLYPIYWYSDHHIYGDRHYGRRGMSSYSTAIDHRGEKASMGLQGTSSYNRRISAQGKAATIMDTRTRGVSGQTNNAVGTRRIVQGSSINSVPSNANENRSSRIRVADPGNNRVYQSSSPGQTRRYVPSYNQTRSVTRSNYNNESYRGTTNSSNPASQSGFRRASDNSNTRSQNIGTRSYSKSGSNYNSGSSSNVRNMRSSSSPQYSRPQYSSPSNYSSGRQSNYNSGSSTGNSNSSNGRRR